MSPRRPARRRALAAIPGALLAVAAALAAGCGYTLGGSLPEHIRTVAVPVFRNSTSEPFIENALTQAVVNAFATSGRVRVVGRADADALLEGEITSYELIPIAVVTGQNIAQYRLLVTMNVVFRDMRRNELLWQQRGLVEQADFRVQGQVSETIAREEAAVRQAAVEIGRKVVSLAMDRF
jgi:hypothetical protein